jgi:hypothetical protein
MSRAKVINTLNWNKIHFFWSGMIHQIVEFYSRTKVCTEKEKERSKKERMQKNNCDGFQIGRQITQKEARHE